MRRAAARASNIMPVPNYIYILFLIVFIVPPKTVAGLLNNETNLRILEKLKARPYYPRELAAEMELSESFLVRRLKAMEEYDIVAGRWETEGGRKVKRYYIKDVTMQLGKDGLEVKSVEAGAPAKFNLQKEALSIVSTFIIAILGFIGIVLSQPVLIVFACLLMAWQMVITASLYRHYHYKTLFTEILFIAISIFIFALDIAVVVHYSPITDSFLTSGLFLLAWCLVFFTVFMFWVRFSQEEKKEWTRDKRDFISSLASASTPVKLFYLLMVLRWRVNEYLGLV